MGYDLPASWVWVLGSVLFVLPVLGHQMVELSFLGLPCSIFCPNVTTSIAQLGEVQES